MNKRFTCRTHSGGIFSMPPRRGRPPVKCTPEHPCDRADTPAQATAAVVAKAVAGIEKGVDFDAMSNAELKAYAREHFSTITKLTSRASLINAMEAQLAKREQHSQAYGKPVTTVLVKPPTRFPDGCPECGGKGGHRAECSHSGRVPAKAPENLAAPRPVANDSLPLAKAAKERLEGVGWVCKGRAWFEERVGMEHWAELTCSRDAETLIIRWQNGVLSSQDYSMENLRVADNNYPDRSLTFDPDEVTDSELVRMVKGMKVTWWNTIAGSKETAIVGGTVTIEHIFRDNGDEDNSKRIVKFLDHGGGGFRAFHASALLKVG